MSIDSGKPSNHYQLLRLQPFETDQDVIRKHFQKLIDQVKEKLKKEPHVIKWKAMQQDFVKAMMTLGDARRKAEYDASLGNKSNRDVRPPDLATILRRRKLVDDVALDRAIKFADTVNIELRDAVVQQKLVTNDVIMPFYADSLGLPFFRLADVAIDESLIPTVPAVMARQQSLVPIAREGRHVIIAAPNPLRSEIEEQLQLRFDASIRQVICTRAAVDQVIAEHYSRETAAAQIASAPQNVATKRAGAKSSSSGEPEVRMSRADMRKQKLKIGFVSGAFTAMVIIFGGTMFTDYGPTQLQLMGAAVGLVAFGIGYVAAN
jgi:transcription elongation GreA/GreB family factor